MHMDAQSGTGWLVQNQPVRISMLQQSLKKIDKDVLRRQIQRRLDFVHDPDTKQVKLRAPIHLALDEF